MDFSLSESQEMLRKSARDFLQIECPKSLVREMEKDETGYPPKLWQKMAGLGWMALVFPEQYGGIGGKFLDLVILLEEMGRACLPAPFLPTVLGGMFIQEEGSESQKEKFLPGIVSGEKILTLALEEPEFRYDPAAIKTKAAAKGDDYIISGVKMFIPYAHVADYIICAARTSRRTATEEGITLFIVDGKSPGVSCTQLKTIASDKQSEVVFDKVKVPKENVLGQLNQGWKAVKRLLQKAAVAKCAELSGISHQALEMAVAYAKERVQFGRPIGSFQAVQHHCANMLVDADGTKYITYKAAWLLSEGLPCDIEVAAAKAWASEAGRHVTALAHQVFGGIGVIVDHDMPLYYTRAKAAELAFGDAEFHRQEIVSQKLKTKTRSWLSSQYS